MPTSRVARKLIHTSAAPCASTTMISTVRALGGGLKPIRAKQTAPTRGAAGGPRKSKPLRAVEATLIDQRATSIMGLDPSGGVFGFTPLSELLVGRFAMLGFVAGLTNECLTGCPILRQIGVASPSLPVFELLISLIGGTIAVAALDTYLRLKRGTMPEADAQRYAHFAAHPFGEDDEAPLNAPLQSAGPEAMVIPQWISDMEMEALHAENARATEMSNGRWAMLGFASAILIEAASGKGIVGQALYYAKALGFVGTGA